MRKKTHYSIVKNIENLRKKNNINWMNILRLALKYNPKETKKLLKKINSFDKKISNEVNSLTKSKL
ncbi:hypothetical protein N9U88_01100 [Candidatus Pelagibacter sp.]|nr:hypothetical protein [Candidatus Pelagibacter sp.]